MVMLSVQITIHEFHNLNSLPFCIQRPVVVNFMYRRLRYLCTLTSLLIGFNLIH